MQNHLLQMVALVAMEQPLNLTAEHIRQEKLKVLNACRPVRLDDLVTGQYEGYRDDDGIDDKATRTETFAAAVLHVRNPRWDGVPFVLKAGKALNDSKVELRVQFHAVPGVVSDLEQCVANELVVVVQPEPAIYWKVQNKVPGLRFEVEQVRMDLLYSKSYILEQMPEAYERLLLEALVNDHSRARAPHPARQHAPVARGRPTVSASTRHKSAPSSPQRSRRRSARPTRACRLCLGGGACGAVADLHPCAQRARRAQGGARPVCVWLARPRSRR